MRRHCFAELLVIQLTTLAACSAHPLPEDVTRKSTFAIVQQLRCEARAGIVEATRRTDPAGNPLLSKQALANTYLGFDFTFDITESNKAASGTLGFTHPFSNGEFLLNINGGVDRTRQAERFFRIVQLFEDLRDDPSCGGETPHANLVYPITGRVGLEEVVGTYAQLRSVTSLRKKEKAGSVFSDELTFTTTLNAGITPTLEINSVAGKFRLTNASIKGSVERKDIHTVVIAIAGKTDVTDIVRGNYLLRSGPSPGLGTGATGVILELDRLRSRNDDARALEKLRLLQ